MRTGPLHGKWSGGVVEWWGKAWERTVRERLATGRHPPSFKKLPPSLGSFGGTSRSGKQRHREQDSLTADHADHADGDWPPGWEYKTLKNVNRS